MTIDVIIFWHQGHIFRMVLRKLLFRYHCFQHVLVNTADQAKSYCPLCRSEFAYRKGMIEHLQVLHGEHLLSELLGVTGSEKDRLMEDLHFK